ncbi:MAG: hypothetical protein UT58_C0013G0005 [Microgenomates group bacterium GW2011_GWC1_39_7b]|uniref:Uncharacterized protein n=3 Tax=Candidatus Woeseibacteriota TaxID=1752722 RepID=A0A0G0LUK4_9BACT|nr:MAG: hypothetical protein UT17_C0004G0023 [Candidatus Woesebacteria bacterium GW2011_GWB1_39_10]KKR26404.1 MAG: hypothetical protein UT58_C0013G0005 [Microgenomates group bacterium GW2011_GWC1_39_7b]KKR72315.1 MAG: hypothetical protein UU16_C0042G0003 [Candidatus Woesebacteria bacterium GW2011_GWA2_40_7]KKS90667.1 MAG: hypothetical protein UV66_C0001G0024 [Candidatus Woesebacteria bacterium GW2011_GWA1_43_12]
MKERGCGYKIVAYDTGVRKEIPCDPTKGCLRELVWSGIGVRRVAAKMLDKESPSEIEAGVEGICLRINAVVEN